MDGNLKWLGGPSLASSWAVILRTFFSIFENIHRFFRVSISSLSLRSSAELGTTFLLLCSLLVLARMTNSWGHALGRTRMPGPGDFAGIAEFVKLKALFALAEEIPNKLAKLGEDFATRFRNINVLSTLPSWAWKSICWDLVRVALAKEDCPWKTMMLTDILQSNRWTAIQMSKIVHEQSRARSSTTAWVDGIKSVSHSSRDSWNAARMTDKRVSERLWPPEEYDEVASKLQ